MFGMHNCMQSSLDGGSLCNVEEDANAMIAEEVSDSL